MLSKTLLCTIRGKQEKFVMQCITEAAMFWNTISEIFPLH